MALLVPMTANAPAAALAPPTAETDGTDFHTSFETGDQEPDWRDTAETGADGTPRHSGVAAPGGSGESAMHSRIGTGPKGGYTNKHGAGYTGAQAFGYGGSHTGEGRGYSYNKVFEVDIDVEARTQLSYLVFPEFTDEDLGYPSTHVAVDLAFDDGSYLSELKAEDQHGFALTPQGQGASKALYADQWNHVSADIGAVAEGRTISRILVAYDNPDHAGAFGGWIDDLRVGAAPRRDHDQLTDYVQTTRGTNSNGAFSRGNNFPATAVPHGFNFWTPTTDAGANGWIYQWHEKNNSDNRPEIQAFSAAHAPSPWMGDRNTFQVMPSGAKGAPDPGRKKRALPFSHDNETAKAHYYGVDFDNGMRAEITPADHSAVMRFTFGADHDANLVFDNITDEGKLNLDTESGAVTGYTDVASGLSEGATRMYVYATFDRPVTGGGRLDGDPGGDVTGYLKFEPGRDRAVTMRIATSLISVEQAERNLALEVPESGAFDRVQRRAQQQWEDKLGVIEVEGASEDQLVTLYSNLYRLFLYPNSGYENTGTGREPRYRYASPVSESGEHGETETGAKVVDGKVFVNNGFWDTYRTTWPAYALFSPEQAGAMADGFVEQYRDGGWISRWSSPGYANLMTGTSSDIAFADLHSKGVSNFDIEAAYDAALRNATVTPPNESVGRKGIATSIFKGYTPSETKEGMSWALEGYVNDHGIAEMSKALYEGAAKDDPRREEYRANAAYFGERAQNYVHMFDDRVGFFQGRKADGDWRLGESEYDPRIWGYDYTETNGWNMAFTVPHDGRGLANLYGGRAELGGKLDEFFATPETGTEDVAGSYERVIHEMREARDVRMGMYGHSNQPSHHIPYMYLYAGQPERTQETVREAMSRLYTGSEIGQGYPGDEDNGEMSAWWLFSALGFYPLQMGTGSYAVGSPLFTKATVNLENGRKLVVNAPDNSGANVYVQGLKVNGKDHTKTHVPHDVLAKGATLDFAMGPRPSSWGTGEDAAPPSPTEGDAVPRPVRDIATGGSSDDGDVAALFDDTTATRTEFGTGTPTIAFETPKPAEAVQYTLTSGPRGAAPSAWRLEGAADGGEWRTIDRREGQSFAWDDQTRPFVIAEPGEYARYRLVVEGGDGDVALSQLELLARP
ncbi:putative alpha-1,2-mannosidase [Murinocardiopsis flavida]|uniref:Putative alpha-1,2-mannosidase n=1 Tax=Murinocardiopsis flavida TaxID=645275 RepID=A0A2P8DEP3_9ACTN|nr:GH92 family glycosyl hydrolase [Murinocardiopsis flavida]PSK95682.1 putative alpha-1,2-mannosidase [Murinocardiopsis flavida]